MAPSVTITTDLKPVDRRRNSHIDALRGAAILVVLILHYPLILAENFASAPTKLIKLIGNNGYYGVTVFFVISGFLITTHSIKRYGSLDAILPYRFYWMRFSRIAPLLLATVTVLTMLHLFGVTGFKAAPGVSIWTALWSALTFQYNWFYSGNGNFGLQPWGPIWSLSIEEMFYVVFPVVCLGLRKPRWIAAVLIVLIVQAPFYRIAPTGQYFLSGTADAIAIGCLTALLVNETRPKPPPWYPLALRAIGFVIIGVIYFFVPVQVHYTLGPSIIACGAGIYLFGAAQSGPPRFRIFWPLEFIGRRSYEIYLIHYPLLFLMKVWIGTSVIPAELTLAIFLIAVAGLGELIGSQFTDKIERLLRSDVNSGGRQAVSAMPRSSPPVMAEATEPSP
jgi:peptidoglycan/LPS O-acetylase OafA/YrhL